MAKRARRRRNPSSNLLPWIMGGVAVASVGYVLYQQQQANAALAAQQSKDSAALAAQQSKDAAALAAAQAKPATPAAPAVTSLNYQDAIDVLDKLRTSNGQTPATILAWAAEMDTALTGLLAADEAAIGGQVWYNDLEAQRRVLQLTPSAFNASVFDTAAQQGEATLTEMKRAFDAGQS